MADGDKQRVESALGENDPSEMGRAVTGKSMLKPWLPSARAGKIIKKTKGYDVPTRETVGRRANPRGGNGE